MSEIRYMISDAARQAGVEAHVLRSWEEELDIKVGRTELGHRYYTDKTIYIMKKVKELRDKGFQLKAIKVLIPEIQKKAEEITEIAEEKNAVMKDTATKTEKAEHTEKTDSDANLKDSTQEVPKPQTILPFVDSLDNLEKFQDIVGDIMKRALQENNVELENRIADSVLKEMEILMKIQEKERKNVTEIWMKPFAPFSITGRWWQRQERRRAIKNGFGFLNKKKIEKQGELLTQLPLLL